MIRSSESWRPLNDGLEKSMGQCFEDLRTMNFNQRGAFRIRFGFQNLGIGDGSIGATRQTQRRVFQ